MKITAIQADITTIAVDAIVNAANKSLMGGGGVDGAIHRGGGPEILDACRAIVARQGGCKVGEAVITTGGRLPAKYVIHTVGPVWNGGSKKEPDLLTNCYDHCLRLAEEHQLESIAFPGISTGVYRFPKDKAAEIAVRTVHNWKGKTSSIKEVLFVCFDEQTLEIFERELAQRDKANP